MNPPDSAWCFKFFLWEAVEAHYAQHGRTDRVETHQLEWTDEQLCMMLDRRFAYYSRNAIPRFIDLFPPDESEELIDITKIITVFSGGSPRDSIRVLQRIFNSYLDSLNRSGTDIAEVKPRIPADAVWNGVLGFSKERFKELVPDSEMRRQLESIHRVSFTSTTLTTSVQKITVNAANSKISSWRQRGAIVHIGDVMINRTGKPNRLYAFRDPRSSICVAGLPAKDFVDQKMRNCAHCGAIQIRDWELDNQLGQCSKCQAALSPETATRFQPDAAILKKARREIAVVFDQIDLARMIAEDLGINIESVATTAEPIWKEVLNQTCAAGPEKLEELLKELIDRAPSGSKLPNIEHLLKFCEEHRDAA